MRMTAIQSTRREPPKAIRLITGCLDVEQVGGMLVVRLGARSAAEGGPPLPAWAPGGAAAVRRTTAGLLVV